MGSKGIASFFRSTKHASPSGSPCKQSPALGPPTSEGRAPGQKRRQRDQTLQTSPSWCTSSPGDSEQCTAAAPVQPKAARAASAGDDGLCLNKKLIFDLLEGHGGGHGALDACGDDDDDGDLEIVGMEPGAAEATPQSAKEGAGERRQAAAGAGLQCPGCASRESELVALRQEADAAQLEAARLRGRELSGCTDEELYFIAKALEAAALKVAHVRRLRGNVKRLEKRRGEGPDPGEAGSPGKILLRREAEAEEQERRAQPDSCPAGRRRSGSFSPCVSVPQSPLRVRRRLM